MKAEDPETTTDATLSAACLITAKKMVSFMKSFGQRRQPEAEAEPADVNAITPSNTIMNADGIDGDTKGSADHQHATALAFDYERGSEVEKKLLRKLDYRLLVRPLSLLSEKDSLTIFTAVLLDFVPLGLSRPIEHRVRASLGAI